ncbi:unnamed protein product [Polarella glacialis]|uniref:Pentatricopeptide repeat-containing protein n=1 Tax=Polarella glacialis TaxID=89957 RepID=A0A813GZQ1_POLGL|nr:unnamed protein product [Polarella glacialis]
MDPWLGNMDTFIARPRADQDSSRKLETRSRQECLSPSRTRRAPRSCEVTCRRAGLGDSSGKDERHLWRRRCSFSAIQVCGYKSEYSSSMKPQTASGPRTVAPNRPPVGALNLVRKQTVNAAALAKGSSWPAAVAAIEELWLDSLEPDTIACNVAMNAMRRGSSSWQRVLKVFRTMFSSSIRPSLATYTNAISSCADARSWCWPLELLDRLRSVGLAPDVVICSAVVSACDRKDWARSLWLLRSMQKHGPKPNLVTYNAAMASSDVQTALLLLEELPDQKISPNAATFGILLTACEEQNCWPLALVLFQRFRRLASRDGVRDCLEPQGVGDFGVSGVLEVLRRVLSTCGRALEWQRALQLALLLPTLAWTASSHTDASSTSKTAAAKPQFLKLPLDTAELVSLAGGEAVTACGRALQWQEPGRKLLQVLTRWWCCCG